MARAVSLPGSLAEAPPSPRWLELETRGLQEETQANCGTAWGQGPKGRPTRTRGATPELPLAGA